MRGCAKRQSAEKEDGFVRAPKTTGRQSAKNASKSGEKIEHIPRVRIESTVAVSILGWLDRAKPRARPRGFFRRRWTGRAAGRGKAWMVIGGEAYR